jgi:hypothetical protein
MRLLSDTDVSDGAMCDVAPSGLHTVVPSPHSPLTLRATVQKRGPKPDARGLFVLGAGDTHALS